MTKKQWLAPTVKIRRYEQDDVLTGSGEFTKDTFDDTSWWEYDAPTAQ